MHAVVTCTSIIECVIIDCNYCPTPTQGGTGYSGSGVELKAKKAGAAMMV